jgi:hypothetical protein
MTGVLRRQKGEEAAERYVGSSSGAKHANWLPLMHESITLKSCLFCPLVLIFIFKEVFTPDEKSDRESKPVGNGKRVVGP